MNKFKKWIRKKHLLWKYNHNYNTGKLIVLTENDRQLGLTHRMLRDCIDKGYILYVHSITEKHTLTHEIWNMKAIDLAPTLTPKSVIFNSYFLTPNDLKCGTHKLRRNVKVIVDNSCTYSDILILHQAGVKIVNGCVNIPFAA